MAFVLSPDLPFTDWLMELDAQLRRSPGFFTGRPVILDLARLSISRPDVAGLMAQLQARGVRIIAVEGVDLAWLGPGLAPLPNAGKPSGVYEFPTGEEIEPEAKPAPAKESAPDAGLVIDQPVRSGQCITYPQGDVTVVGSVSSGSEIVAGGSIHIYGTLRGRAIAGCSGNRQARIFCSRLEAELLAIDGLYRTVDEIDAHLRGGPVCAWLHGDTLMTARQG
jgi:septum site-determining protein MinC